MSTLQKTKKDEVNLSPRPAKRVSRASRKVIPLPQAKQAAEKAKVSTGPRPRRPSGKVEPPSAENSDHRQPVPGPDRVVASPVPTDADVKVAGYKVHPLAMAFRLLPEKELSNLADSIRRIGQQEPAVLYEGMILDGRCRATACERLGIPLQTKPMPEGIEPVEYVAAVNANRRHCTPTQRAVAAINLMPHFAALAAKRKALLSGTRANPGGSRPQVTEIFPEPAERGEAREKAAKATGANPKYVSDLVRLQREAPDLFSAVDAETITIPQAMKELGRRNNKCTEHTGSQNASGAPCDSAKRPDDTAVASGPDAVGRSEPDDKPAAEDVRCQSEPETPPTTTRQRVHERYCASIAITNLLAAILQLTELDQDPGHEERTEDARALLHKHETRHREFVTEHARKDRII